MFLLFQLTANAGNNCFCLLFLAIAQQILHPQKILKYEQKS